MTSCWYFGVAFISVAFGASALGAGGSEAGRGGHIPVAALPLTGIAFAGTGAAAKLLGGLGDVAIGDPEVKAAMLLDAIAGAVAIGVGGGPMPPAAKNPLALERVAVLEGLLTFPLVFRALSKASSNVEPSAEELDKSVVPEQVPMPLLEEVLGPKTSLLLVCASRHGASTPAHAKRPKPYN